MTASYDELTIDQVLADPMIRKVMRADRVEPLHLERLLRHVASQRPARQVTVAPLALASKGPGAARAIFCGVPCA